MAEELHHASRAARVVAGAKIAELRRTRGWTQNDLARRTGTDRSSISHIERGTQPASEQFWDTADRVLGASGDLREQYVKIVAARRAKRTATTRRPASDGTEPLGHVLSAAVASWHEAPATTDEEVMAAGPVAMEWLLESNPRDGVSRSKGVRSVGVADVGRLRTVRAQLKDMDNALGGGASLPMARAYMRQEIPELLNSRYTETVGRGLLGAVAEFSADLGWMAYDEGKHGEARRQLLYAMRLAGAADDRLFGGRVAISLCHQSLALGRFAEGVALARVATRGFATNAPSTAVAMAHAMEACALAASNDERGCSAALAIAEAALQRARAEEAAGLPWLDFDEGALIGHAARAWRDLGKTRQAIDAAEQTLAMARPEHARTRAQRRAILATALVHSGEYERASTMGQSIVEDSSRIHSGLVRGEVRRLAGLLSQRGANASREFLADARQHLRDDVAR